MTRPNATRRATLRRVRRGLGTVAAIKSASSIGASSSGGSAAGGAARRAFTDTGVFAWASAGAAALRGASAIGEGCVLESVASAAGAFGRDERAGGGSGGGVSSVGAPSK
ncbi:MAG: hypothetical protein MUF34_37280 [Polyangiaceae bacterium]|jgi:hypothetical protein|nr:hypothetical protein [Polyangiaceae bacterium]